jgi:hypothetical protein
MAEGYHNFNYSIIIQAKMHIKEMGEWDVGWRHKRLSHPFPHLPSVGFTQASNQPSMYFWSNFFLSDPLSSSLFKFRQME